MSDNPFLEPDDTDRTIIRPSPGGRSAGRRAGRSRALERRLPGRRLPERPDRRSRPRRRASARAPKPSRSAVNPLVAAAAPLLQLMARLRNTVNPPDPGDLRERAVRQMHDFRAGGARSRPAARAAAARPTTRLCASLDDVVLNTPWGSTGVWDAHSLVSTFHKGSAQRRALLRSARADAAESRPLSAGHRADVSLHVARVSGAVSAVAARPGRPRPAARGDLRRHRAPAAGGRARACRRIGRASRRPIAAGAHVGAGVGCGQPGPGRARRPVRLVLDRPQRGVGRSVRPPAGGAAAPDAGYRAHRAGAAAAAANPSRPPDRAAARCSSPRSSRVWSTVTGKPPYPLVRINEPRHVRLGKRDGRPELRARC